jgi:hypothetical protein
MTRGHRHSCNANLQPSSSQEPKPSTSSSGDSEDFLSRVLRQTQSDFRSELEENVLSRLNSNKGGPVKNKKKSGTKSDVNDDDVLAAKVAEHLLPLLAKQMEIMMKKTVESAVCAIVDEVKATTERLQQTCLQLRYQLDRQEQYSRRETIRICGLPEKIEEDVEKEILRVFSDAGCTVSREEISTAHRNGQKQEGKCRPILVKFVSRRSKTNVMKKKSSLKGKELYKRVYLNDDLTPLRMRLLRLVKKIDGVERASTTPDGRIRCEMKKRPGQTNAAVVLVDSPDDLFKLGVDQVDYEELGLHHLLDC